MTQEESNFAPDSTAVRVALWRALHLQVDKAPHVLVDEVGLRLAPEDPAWRSRPDMDPEFTLRFRASIVARARFIEDMVSSGFSQYVILGAGLDTFVQRRPEYASKLKVFEVDRPGPQAWKRKRLIEQGYGIPDWLSFVPVDFEANGSWKKSLLEAGFDANRPALIASTGVSMYLSREANQATLREAASFASGTTFVMSYLLPLDLGDQATRTAEKGARESKTPFVSFFTAPEMLAMAREAGFAEARQVSADDLNQLYFSERDDGLQLSKSEELLVAVA